jgi:AcrR family transcriptional regulator
MRRRQALPPRDRMVRAAAELLATGGREAVSTRAVSAAADVQAPAIYRQFGDMRGLLEAAAAEVFARYLESKRTRPRDADPVEDLRHAWDQHVEFGLQNPSTYALLYGDPRPDAEPAMVREGNAILRELVQRIAEAGRLRVPVDRAVGMMLAAGRGLTLTLLGIAPEARDAGLSDAAREAVIAAIAVEAPRATSRREGDGDIARRAVALKAALKSQAVLSPAETSMLAEWLDRLSAG